MNVECLFSTANNTHLAPLLHSQVNMTEESRFPQAEDTDEQPIGLCHPVQIQPTYRHSLPLVYSHLCQLGFPGRNSWGRRTQRHYILVGTGFSVVVQPGCGVTKGKQVLPMVTIASSNETHLPLLCSASEGPPSPDIITWHTPLIPPKSLQTQRKPGSTSINFRLHSSIIG